MHQRYTPTARLIWVTAYAIAMGYLESAVVVYLRALLYPHGFSFPMEALTPSLAVVEVVREAATVIMLFAVGFIAGRSIATRFAYFLLSFGVWDLCYYLFLKIILGWPRSLLTWDILFLIPITWSGPVVAPIVVSFTMIVLALVIVRADSSDESVSLSRSEWSLLVAGALVVVASFVWDMSMFMLTRIHTLDLARISEQTLVRLSAEYVPQRFNWPLFAVGELLILVAVTLFALRVRLRRG